MKKFALIATAALLHGYAVAQYISDGKIFSNRAQFLQAVDASVANAVAQIRPLPAPLTSKRLAFGLQPPAVTYQAAVRYHAATRGLPSAEAIEQYDTLAYGNFRGSKGLYEAAERSNIYLATRFVELDSMTATIAPSAEEDVIYWFETRPGAGAWVFATQKSGPQVFAFDRTQPTPADRAKAFVEALQVQARRQ